MNRKLRQLTTRMLTVLALFHCASNGWSLTTDAASPANFVASYDYEEIAHADSTWEREVPVAVTAFTYDDAIVQAPKAVRQSDASPAAPNASLHRILHLLPRPPPTDASTTISRFLNAPKSIVNSFDDIATYATRNPGSNKVVLGKFSEGGRSYTKVGAHYKASYLKVENWNQVTKGMTEAEIWRINEAFLRQQLSAGKQVILSHNPATATGFFKREVEFLTDAGFRFVQDGWVWRAVK